MRIPYYLLGYEDMEVCRRHTDCFLNLCRSAKVAYQPRSAGEEGQLRVRCLATRAAWLHRACHARGIELQSVHRGGLPVLLARYRYRIGLLIGVLLACFLLYIGSGVLWDVRISGNKTVSDERILEQLAACGLTIGCRLGEDGPDSREIENRMLRTTPEIAWISVNLRGTVANVQVRELQAQDSAVETQTANLVAAYDGIVESVRLLSGEVVVEVGQQVRAGELLISGVRDSGVYGFDVIGARGEVMARTEHAQVIQIPLQVEQKAYTGEEKCEKSIFFFGKSIKFSKSTGIIGGSCDTIYMMENWTLPTGVELPVGIRYTRHKVYEMETVQRTRRQAYELAVRALDEHLSESAADALLLSKSIRVSYTETHCILVCDYTCLRNIAVAVPLEYQEN